MHAEIAEERDEIAEPNLQGGRGVRPGRDARSVGRPRASR